jgi:hypothetical protein
LKRIDYSKATAEQLQVVPIDVLKDALRLKEHDRIRADFLAAVERCQELGMDVAAELGKLGYDVEKAS